MVRIKDCSVKVLPRQEFLGEHAELHVAYNALGKNYILTKLFPNFYQLLRQHGIRIGYIKHPNVQRFNGHIGQLIDRHKQQITEFQRRDYQHNSPLLPFPCPVKPEAYSYSIEAEKQELARIQQKLRRNNNEN